MAKSSTFVLGTPIAAAFVALALIHPGCSSCPPGGDTLDVDIGKTNAARTVYESAPWDGEYHEYEPQVHYRFKHHLPGKPALVQAYVAFDRTPLAGKGKGSGNVSLAAGDEAFLEHDDDWRVIKIRNNTCQPFFIRIVASDPVEPEGGAGGSGGSAPVAEGGAGEDAAGGTAGSSP